MKSERERLVEEARAVQSKAYAPYSKFKVGAAVLVEGGEIFAGGNVENASFPAGVCAECSAVSAAVSAGHRRIVMVCVVTAMNPPGAPCGVCRQVLAEFGPDMTVLLTRPEEGAEVMETKLTTLLPGHFNGDAL